MRKKSSIVRLLVFLSLILLFGVMTACGGQETPESTRESAPQEESRGMSGSILVEMEQEEIQEENIMKVTIGSIEFTATLADNSSARALVELLQEGPLTIDMHDYANMEKVGPIGQSLPVNNEQITTGPGDIILYLGDSLVIYYDTNSWNFTRIGKINDVTQEELLAAMGSGNVSVTFELEE